MARGRVAVALLVVGLLGTAGCGGKPGGSGSSPGPSASPAPSPPSPIPVGTPLVFRTDNAFNARQLGIKDIRALDPDQAYVTTPHYNIGLDAVLTTTTLDQPQINAVGLNSTRSGPPVYGPLNAEPGHEFLLAHTVGGPRGRAYAQPGGKAEVAIRIGDRTSTVSADEVNWGLVLVQVPVGTDPFLVVTDAGRTLSISLRTGKRGESVPSYRVLGGLAGLKTVIEVDRFGQIPLELTLGASLLPYVDGRGWAPAGHAWLDVSPSAMVVGEDVDLHLALPASFEVRGASGPFLVLPAGSLDTTATMSLGSGGTVAFFDVPDNLRSLRYLIRLNLTVTGAKDHAKLGWRPVGPTTGSGTITLA
jgi:hypothetical protein